MKKLFSALLLSFAATALYGQKNDSAQTTIIIIFLIICFQVVKH